MTADMNDAPHPQGGHAVPNEQAVTDAHAASAAHAGDHPDGGAADAISDMLNPDEPRTIDTSNQHLQDGVNRCPKCGSTDIQLRVDTGMLVCLFCRYEWAEARIGEQLGSGESLSDLTGTTIGAGAADISADIDDVVTLKCQGCGSEVVINTAESMHARCHWCRHVLTINDQIPNGAVPDAVLPFHITHEQAVAAIRAFAGKRRTFAHREFKQNFTPENVLGVYLPYMVVDANAAAHTWGQGEVQTGSYTREEGNSKVTYYNADVYDVQRNVEFTVDDLTIESSVERGNMDTFVNTNNIINTILPFDTENAVRWNANYLTGFSSEKRDQDISALQPVFEHQVLSIARDQIASSVRAYDRGVRWYAEALDVRGTQWVSMYLPVWLYSYYHEERGKGMVHYIAVNGRTGETMGSVPVSHGRLLLAALTAGTILEGIAIGILVATA